jgi:hypothetical protein
MGAEGLELAPCFKSRILKAANKQLAEWDAELNQLHERNLYSICIQFLVNLTHHKPKKSAIKNLKPLIYRWFEVFID